MARVQIYAATSVDGYLAPPDGSVGWLEAFGGGPDLGYDDFYRSVGSLVVGRTTYEQVRGFGDWPYAGKPAVVLTRRGALVDLPDGVTSDDGSDLLGLVRRLGAATPDGTIWLVGGGEVHRAFLAAVRRP